MKKLSGVVAAIFFMSIPAWSFEIQSSDIREGQAIPRQFTCTGRNQSPGLEWRGEPQGTVSFVLICEDPDAPMGIWTHWIVFNIPASTHALESDAPPNSVLAGSARQGLNDFQQTGYGGPCPPLGQRHRYEFKLYALDVVIPLTGALTRSQLLTAMEGHVLAETKLTGIFKR